ncbi:MAG: prolipoprotein diacylglyceryl transferase [Deltaproteobacteria bacterium]|nr:prolipoprotein diacylglyceryl transferase [Deltaproteobacteria bacterium]
MNNFLKWWQHLPGQMDPVIFEVGGFKLQYYGLMYIIAFGITYYLVLFRVKHESRFSVSSDRIEDLTVNMIIGLIIGARLGYVLFYNPGYYIRHPLEVFLPFEFSNGITFTGISGMSYHGGALGVVLASWLYTRKAGLNFWEMADLYAPVIPLGYTFGRIGNFINGELYGRVTASPVGMYFPTSPETVLRHPSQLYEAFFEGIFLFVVLWNLRKLWVPRGSMVALYLIGYGLIRFFIEYFRQPDAHLGFIFLSFSMGQILCGIMIISGILIYAYLHHREKRQIIPVK